VKWVNNRGEGRLPPPLLTLRRLPGGRAVVLPGTGALEHQRVAVLDAAVAIQVVVARGKAGVLKADREVFPAVAGAFPCCTDAKLAAVDFEGGRVLVGPVENPREVGGDFVRQRLDGARVAGIGSFERSNVVTNDVVSFSFVEAAPCSLAYGQISAVGKRAGHSILVREECA
jgi:hypothetical protein